MSRQNPPPTLCVVVCAAGPAPHVGVLVELAQRDGWAVRVVATPAGMGFIDTNTLAAQTGAPVRSDYRSPGDNGPRSSTADAIIVAPATYNSINKLATGINDTYALNVVAEAVGRRAPVAILPFVNAALAARAPFRSAVESLRSEGVHVLLGPGEWQPHPAGAGEQHLASYPWHHALTAVTKAQR